MTVERWIRAVSGVPVIHPRTLGVAGAAGK